MVINIRGTSGSGKSTTVRRVMEHYADGLTREYKDGGKKIEGYRYVDDRTTFYILGDYDTSECGGCDKIRTQDEICQLVEANADRGHVLFEGLLASTIFQRYYELSRTVQERGLSFVFLFLNTPLQECLRRVRERRRRQGNPKPLNETGTRDKYALQLKHYHRLKDLGCRVASMNGDRAAEQIIQRFQEF